MNTDLLLPKDQATFPVKYEAAKAALQECAEIDECKQWSDMAQALSSYAKQADDYELERTAKRIRARALKRCGELLKQIEPASGHHRKSEGAPTFSREDAARQAGMSKHQQVQAVRIARVPDEDFEEQVESDDPPTIESLAGQGIKKRSDPHSGQTGMTRRAYGCGIGFRWNLAKMVGISQDFDVQDVVDGSTPEDREKMREQIPMVQEYLNAVLAKL